MSQFQVVEKRNKAAFLRIASFNNRTARKTSDVLTRRVNSDSQLRIVTEGPQPGIIAADEPGTGHILSRVSSISSLARSQKMEADQDNADLGICGTVQPDESLVVVQPAPCSGPSVATGHTEACQDSFVSFLESQPNPNGLV